MIGIYYFPFYFLAFILLSGCASLRGSKQQLRLACNAPACEVIDEDGKKLGTAPGLIEVDRQRHKILTFKSDKNKASLSLDSRFRWLDSLAANYTLSLFGNSGYGILGLGIDLMTGAAWNYEAPKIISFNSTPKYQSPPRILAIAPPQASSELLSDIIGEHLEITLKRKYPQAKILPYDDTLPIFQRSNYSFENTFDSELMLVKTLKSSPLTHYAETKIKTTPETVVADVRIVDAYRTEPIGTLTLAWKKSENPEMHAVAESYWTQRLVELLPNSIGVASITNFSTGNATDTLPNSTDQYSYYYDLEQVPNSDLIAGRLGLTSAQIRPDLEDRFQYVFKWASNFHLFRSKYWVRKAPMLNTQTTAFETLGQATIYNFGFGIGPEIGIAGQFGYYYFSIIPSIGTYYTDYGKQSKSEFLGNIDTTINIGYLTTITTNSYFRVSLGLLSNSQKNVSHIIEKYSHTPVKAAYLSQTRIAFSYEYYLPLARNTLKQKFRSWF